MNYLLAPVYPMGDGFTLPLLTICQVYNRHRLLTGVLEVLDETGFQLFPRTNGIGWKTF